MNRIIRIVVVASVLLAFTLSALGDTLYLKSGKTFEGKLISESGGQVKFKTSFGVLTFPADQVEKIEKGRTQMDEFRERRKKIADGDYGAMLELARWCRDQKLLGQRLQVLRDILRECPDHPGARREREEIYRDGEWVKLEGDPPTPRVEPSKRVEIPETRASVILPRDWKTEIGKGEAKATGPNPYAIPPVLTLTFGKPAEEPKKSFPDQEGWQKPKEVSAAGLTGLRSRRNTTEGGIARVEALAVLSGGDTGLTVRLTSLALEADAYAEAIDLVLRSLELEAPPADYTNNHYKYAFNLPKGEGFGHHEDDEHDVLIGHDGKDATEWARLSVVTGNPGDEFDAVRTLATGLVAAMKTQGDITREDDFSLGGQAGHIVDGTFLDSGIPVRRRVVTVEREKRLYLLYFTQHEFGQEKTNVIWDTVVPSFRFLD